MNKQEMVKAISTKTGLTQVDTNKVLAALENITFEAIKKGEKVQLTGFCTIKPVYRAERKGFDPIKKKEIAIAPTVGVSIKPGEKLRAVTKDLDVTKFAPQEKKEDK